VLVAVLAVAVPIAVLAGASSASAAVHHPKGEFAPFYDCPYNPEVSTCVVATTESGEFTIGKERVPITNPITLQGGVSHFFSGQEEKFFAAEDGNTLSKSPQKVPGGLAGLVKCPEISNPIVRAICEGIFENGITGVNATTELAAPASAIGLHALALLSGQGIALSLPIKIHLENPLLGNSCYIGSNAHPVVIEFTTGTTTPPPPNKPITGKPGTLSENANSTILTDSGNELVNNSYAAPAAEGCGEFFFIKGYLDGLVNAKLGLPSAAGHNTAILRGKLKAADQEAVKASE
jgi:hypothetical protein